MRILFISYYNPLGKGGFEKQAMGLMNTFASQGHEIACLTIATPENQAQIQIQNQNHHQSQLQIQRSQTQNSKWHSCDSHRQW